MREDILEELGLEVIQAAIQEMHDKNLTIKDLYSLGEKRIYQARHVFANKTMTAQKLKQLRLVRLKELNTIKVHFDALQAKKAARELPKHHHEQIMRFKLYMLIWAWCLTVLVCMAVFNKSSAVMILFAVVIQYLFDLVVKGGT